MVKREVFEKIGLFDERYFLYYEESDFCYRAKEAGYKIMYIPKAIVYHKNAQTTGLGSPLQDYYITRNRMLFASKFLPLRTRFALFREGIRNWSNPTRKKAHLDFLFGKFGRGVY
jgi:GT2 family glycosyltransferase